MTGYYTDGAPATRTRGNGLAIASLVCGIVGLLVFNIILGPLAVIFGGVGLRNANRGEGHRTMSWAGLVLGVVDIALFAVLLAAATNHSFSWHAG